jgi:hypothetical protein
LTVRLSLTVSKPRAAVAQEREIKQCGLDTGIALLDRHMKQQGASNGKK